MGLFDFGGDDSLIRQGGAAAKQGFKRARRDATEFGELANTALTEGKTEGLGYLDTYADKAAPILEGAGQEYGDLYARAAGQLTNYEDLINNPDSIYDSELYKSITGNITDQAGRFWNARGMDASGNHLLDLSNQLKTSGLDYFNTLTDKYQPYFGMAQFGAAGLNQADTQLADMWTNLGTNKSNVATGTAANQAGNYGNMAKTLSDIAMAKGLSQQQMYNNLYTADAAETQNMWNGILGLTGGLFGAAGNAGGFGKLFG